MDKGRPRRIVADSSALAAVIMEEEGWEQIASILSENIVYSVDFAWTECTNVLWKARAPERVERLKKTMDLVDRFKSSADYVNNALEISLEENIPIYDAIFVELAREEAAGLITRDARQGKVARKWEVDVILL